MDPETTLGELRALTAEGLAIWDDMGKVTRHGSQGEARLAEIGREMAEKFEALDGWLSRGGFAPAAWRGAETEDHR